MGSLSTGIPAVFNAEFKAKFQDILDNHQAIFPGSLLDMTSMRMFPETIWAVTTIFESKLHGCTKLNDPFHVSYQIDDLGNGQYKVSVPHGITLLVSPFEEDAHLAYSVLKIPFTAVVGSAEQVINAVKKAQEKQLELVKQYKDRIKNFGISNLKDVI